MSTITIPKSWCGVYHIIRDGVVIYVGQTTNVFSRISSWRSGKFKDEHFDRVDFFPCGIDELNTVEEEHICRLRPVLNAEGVTLPYCGRIQDAPRWWFERRAAAQVRACLDVQKQSATN